MTVGEGIFNISTVIQWNFRCTIKAMNSSHYMNTQWVAMAGI